MSHEKPGARLYPWPRYLWVRVCAWARWPLDKRQLRRAGWVKRDDGWWGPPP